MKFWSSSESNGEALAKLLEICQLVDDQIETHLEASELKTFDVKVRYIPIIMTDDRRGHYPARSRVEHKNRIYNCCPQLDYDAFVSSTPAERVAIYLDGLRGCGSGLTKLGATREQVAAFDRILGATLQAVTKKLTGG
jgi:hypothetical protein